MSTSSSAYRASSLAVLVLLAFLARASEAAEPPGFGVPFMQRLGAVTYEFKKMRETSSIGRYDDMMVSVCRGVGMRPVIDAPGPNGENYSGAGDARGLKIQGREVTGEGEVGGTIMKKSERDDVDKYPAGWAMIKDHFAMLCGYRANQNGGQALCDTGTSTTWRTLTSSGHPGESPPSPTSLHFRLSPQVLQPRK